MVFLPLIIFFYKLKLIFKSLIWNPPWSTINNNITPWLSFVNDFNCSTNCNILLNNLSSSLRNFSKICFRNNFSDLICRKTIFLIIYMKISINKFCTYTSKRTFCFSTSLFFWKLTSSKKQLCEQIYVELVLIKKWAHRIEDLSILCAHFLFIINI